MTNEQFAKPYVYQRNGKWCCGFRHYSPIPHKFDDDKGMAYQFFVTEVSKLEFNVQQNLLNRQMQMQNNAFRPRAYGLQNILDNGGNFL
jgi:hypothetical protein